MPEKYKRCVRKVRAKGGVRNPHAICTAANAGNIKQYRKREAKKKRKGKKRDVVLTIGSSERQEIDHLELEVDLDGNFNSRRKPKGLG